MRFNLLAAITVSVFGQLLLDASASAQDALPYSYGQISIRECSAFPCEDTTIQKAFAADYDYNANLSVSVPGKGSARLLASPGDAVSFGLPVLKAESIVSGGATSTAFVQAFQGYQNVSDQTLELAFSGQIDFSASGTGYGFILPSLAILTTAVRDPIIGAQWLQSTNDGAFITDCQTEAAISVVSGSRQTQPGGASVTIESSTGSCNGESLFSVLPGDSFYILGRMLTFQALPGSRNAFDTFHVELSPLVPESTRAILSSALRPIGLGVVPEPASWALMLAGFGFVGLAARGHRNLSLASGTGGFRQPAFGR